MISLVDMSSALAAKRIGAFVTSGTCHAAKENWLLAFEEPKSIIPHYEHFRIPPGAPRKPQTLAEAHLDDSQLGDEEGVWGAWKAQFEAWLDYIEDTWFPNSNIVLFSDREAKDMVVQQYDLIDGQVARAEKLSAIQVSYSSKSTK